MDETTGMTWIADGMDTVTDIFVGVVDVITSDPLLTAFFVAGAIIPVGLRVFRRFRRL